MPWPVVRLVADARVREDVVRALQLAGPHGHAREALGHAEPWALNAELQHRRQLVALERLDHHARGRR